MAIVPAYGRLGLPVQKTIVADPQVAEFIRRQRALRMSDAEIAEFLCVGPRNVRRWKRGQLEIPRWVVKFLPMMVALDEPFAGDPGNTIDRLREMAGLDGGER